MVEVTSGNLTLRSLTALCLLSLALSACGKDPPASASAALLDRKSVTAVLDGMEKDPEIAAGSVGFYVASLKQPDKPLVARAAKKGLIPASTMKLLTTGVALYELGPDFRFETTVSTSAQGDVIVRGSGDPTLCRNGWDEVFSEWADALDAADIGEVFGRLIADESAWESQEIPDGWAWADIANYYAPFLTPLTFHDNEFRLVFDVPTVPGWPCRVIEAEPWPTGLTFSSEVTAGPAGSGDRTYLYGGPGARRYVARGTLGAGSGRMSIRGAFPDPGLECLTRFAEVLGRREVPVHEITTSRRLEAAEPPQKLPAAEKTIHSHFSAPLSEIVVPINHRSLNLDCECLLRTLGQGKSTAGLERIRRWLEAQSLPLAGYEQADGCGLARQNMITPELEARALAAFLNGPNGEAFRHSLPVVGESGTVRRLGRAKASVVRAKSGSIERVRCYCGVVERPDGQQLVFSIMVNNFTGSGGSLWSSLDSLFQLLAGEPAA